MYSQEELPAEEVEVVKDYEVTVKDAKRIKTLPDAYEIEVKSYNYEYDMDVSPLQIEYPSPYIRPVAMKPDRANKEYNGYLRGSYGTLNNPSFAAQYDLVSENYYTLGFKADFERMEDTKVVNKKYGETYFDIHADYFLTQERKVSLQVGADLRDISAFGFNADTLTTVPGLQNGSWSDMFLVASYVYDDLGSPFGYGAKFRFDRVAAALVNDDENDIALELFGKTQIKNFGLLNLIGGLKYTNLVGLEDINDLILYTNPSILFSKGKTGIKLGAEIANANETTAIFPDASIRVNLSKQAFILELGANGTFVQQNLKQLSAINPFMQELKELKHSKQYNFYGSLSGHLKKEISYNGKVGYKIINDLQLFENDFVNNLRLFNTRREDFNLIYLTANLSLHPMEALSIDVGLTKNFYSVTGGGIQDFPQGSYGLVPLTIETKAIYRLINERLHFTANLNIMEGVKYYDQQLIESKTKSAIDMNFGVEGKVIDAVKIFAQANNVFSSNYERWYGYNDFGANFLAGLSLKF